MPTLFPSPAIEVLTADGRLERVGGQTAGRGRPLVLVPREICAFEHFDPGPGSRSAATVAAYAHAGQASPFLNAGALVRRQGRSFGIWWWNLDAVAAPLRTRFGETPPRIAPASLAQPAGEGWRIVRLDHGYEAQLWRDGALLASTWRREPFDQTAWTAFTRVRRGETDAPATPPAALPLPLVPEQVRKAIARDLTPQETAVIAVAAAAVLMILASAFFLGQGLRLSDQTRALTEEAARIATARPAASVDDQRLSAYRALAQRPDVVSALARAIGVAELYGASPSAYAADTGQVSLTIPYTAISSLDRIALELRDTGLFTEIRPVTDTERGVIELHLTLAGGTPVSPAG